MELQPLPQSRKEGRILRLLAGVFLCAVSIWGTPSPTLAKPAPDMFEDFDSIEEEPPAPPPSTAPVPKKDPAPLSAPVAPVAPPASASPKTPAPAAPKSSAKIEKLKEDVRKKPNDGKLIAQLARELAKTGESENATRLLWQHVEKLDRAGMILLIQTHQDREEWNDVVRAANLLIAKNQKDEEALTYLGNAQFKRRKIDDAKDALKKALEINKMYQPAYETLGRIYEKNPYEQRLLYQDMVETFGPKPAFLTKLCAINTVDGENEQGQQVCRQAVESDAQIPENHVNLGLIARQKGEPERAEKLLKAAADRFPRSEYAQYENAASLESAKNYVDAYKYYDRCIAADAKSERCLVGLGNTSIQIRKYDRAYEAFKVICRTAGRKYGATVRRAAHSINQRKEESWALKFEQLAERCIQ